ncbi:hypothetical protein [Paenibacillus xylaniclasticus]|uniref:hypothetical protein n=1 Tax=Paenibacillus xylaniclasticus TaxID=588083 RepID=UPI000FD86F79|nr:MULTISPECIES: hypothetical protein [Paenibacillus]GFN34008.1 hypothetical protein PCURB6_42680 [Paenibacillus curdlanolyticus]
MLRSMYKRLRSRLRIRLAGRLLPGLLIAAVLLLAAGCGGGSGKYDHKMKAQHYGHDGYMGLTNTNPSLPNSPHSLTIKNDTDFVDQKLRTIRGVDHTRIAVEGSKMVVTIYPVSGLSAIERKGIKNQAEAMVRYNMPRYDVNVNIAP